VTETVSPDNSSNFNAADGEHVWRDWTNLLALCVPVLIGLYLLITSTTYPIPDIWPYDGKRILQFCLLLVLFLVPVVNKRIRYEFTALLLAIPLWIRLLLFFVFAWGVLSAMVHARSLMHALNSLSEVALLTSLVLGVFVVASCRRISGLIFDQIAIGMIALTVLAVGLQEIIGTVAILNMGVEFNFRVTLMHFSYPRFYNQVQSWAIPALLALPVLFPRKRWAPIACALILGLQWYIILLTGARGSFIALAAALILAVTFLPPVRPLFLKWQTVGFVLGAVLFSTMLYSFESSSNDRKVTQPHKPTIIYEGDRNQGSTALQLRGGESSFFKQSVGRPMNHTTGRSWLWKAAVADASNNPLLGIGPMNYACTSSREMGHPHNFPLQLAAEWGIPVAFVSCALIFALLLRVAKDVRQGLVGSMQENALAGVLLISVLTAGIYACLSGVLVMPASQTTGLLVCGMLLGLYPRAHTDVTQPILRWGTLPGLIMSVGLLLLGSYELVTMKDRGDLLSPAESLYPRIWQDAKVCKLYAVQNEVKN